MDWIISKCLPSFAGSNDGSNDGSAVDPRILRRFMLLASTLFPLINGLAPALAVPVLRRLGFQLREAVAGILSFQFLSTALWHVQNNQENPMILGLMLGGGAGNSDVDRHTVAEAALVGGAVARLVDSHPHSQSGDSFFREFDSILGCVERSGRSTSSAVFSSCLPSSNARTCTRDRLGSRMAALAIWGLADDLHGGLPAVGADSVFQHRARVLRFMRVFWMASSGHSFPRASLRFSTICYSFCSSLWR